MSYQAVPEIEAEACTGVGCRHTLWAMAAAHTGKAPGLFRKASRSAAVGARASSSPPPSTSTTLLTGEFGKAAAPTRTFTLIAFGFAAPAASTSVAVQVKVVAPAAPTQAQPVPVGVASSVSPTGRRSLTRYRPTVGAWPPLRTRIV